MRYMDKKISSTKTKTSGRDTARERGLNRLNSAPRAKSVSVDSAGKSIKIELLNGVVISVPTHLIQVLNEATRAEICDVELLLDGLYVRWPQLDEDLKIQSLIEGTFGTDKWMSGLKTHLAELGRKGGRSRSTAKSIASRLNGAKGGRPRKSLTT